MKNVLVTGGNRGIGFEICQQLDQLGYRVLLGSRDMAKGKAAAEELSENVEVVQLDVSNKESIAKLFQHIQLKYKKIDVLINNAGLGASPVSGATTNNLKSVLKNYMKPLFQFAKSIKPLIASAGFVEKNEQMTNVDMDRIRELMETNCYGPIQMIQSFLPLLKKSDDPRVINISSGMGQMKELNSEYPAYRLSKAALNTITIMFAKEFEKDKIRINAMCPGWVKTDMGGPDAPRSVQEGAETAIWLVEHNEIGNGLFYKDKTVIDW